jgi:hypothetical protein
MLFGYLIAGGFFYAAWNEFDKSKEYIIYDCRVNSYDVKHHGKIYYGIWDVTVMDKPKSIDTDRYQRIFTCNVSTICLGRDKKISSEIFSDFFFLN